MYDCRCGHLQRPTQPRRQCFHILNRTTLNWTAVSLMLYRCRYITVNESLKYLWHIYIPTDHMYVIICIAAITSKRSQVLRLRDSLRERETKEAFTHYDTQPIVIEHIFGINSWDRRRLWMCVQYSLLTLHSSSNWYRRARLCCVRGLSLEYTGLPLYWCSSLHWYTLRWRQKQFEYKNNA